MKRDDLEAGQTWSTPRGWVEILDVLDVQVHVRWIGSIGPAYTRISWLLDHGELAP